MLQVIIMNKNKKPRQVSRIWSLFGNFLVENDVECARCTNLPSAIVGRFLRQNRGYVTYEKISNSLDGCIRYEAICSLIDDDAMFEIEFDDRTAKFTSDPVIIQCNSTNDGDHYYTWNGGDRVDAIGCVLSGKPF